MEIDYNNFYNRTAIQVINNNLILNTFKQVPNWFKALRSQKYNAISQNKIIIYNGFAILYVLELFSVLINILKSQLWLCSTSVVIT